MQPSVINRSAQRLIAIPLAVRLAGLACGILFMRYLWVSDQIQHGPVLCPFRLLTGHPCPMCGSTRAVAALCAGDLATAWRLNPFGTSLATAGIAGLVIPNSLMKFQSGFRWVTSRFATTVSVSLATVSLAGIWLWTLSRW